jgi:iron(III) transport system substrate-binding protein
MELQMRVISPGILALFAVLALTLVSCGRGGGDGEQRVVLYSSVDDYLLRVVVRAFEQETGIRVDLAGDTEATKTTGLVQRLLAERSSPRADVWWSSEPFGTIQLSREGLLEPYTSGHEAEFEGGWPVEMRGEQGDWYGFASRARVIVYNTQRLQQEQAPTRLRDLADPRWRGRIGMARPQFGTTRGHMGALVAICGPDATEAWLRRMRENGLRLYDGNATVVRAVAHGEIDLGLTDTDDVWAGQREGWPVELVFEAPDAGGADGLCSFGPMLIPNTVAMMRGGPNPAAAARLIEFILSERVERLLAESESGNIPVRPGLAAQFPRALIPEGRLPDLQRVADHIPPAMDISERALR